MSTAQYLLLAALLAITPLFVTDHAVPAAIVWILLAIVCRAWRRRRKEASP